MRKIYAVTAACCALVMALSSLVLVAGRSQAAPGTPSVNTQTNQKQTIAALAAPACRRQSAANAYGQDILLSTPDPYTYTGTAWVNVTCTGTTFRLGYNQRALVVANVSAETDCNGTTPTNGQWCQARALLNGIEGAPVAAEPSSFAFDSVAGGSYNWQAHDFNRGWEVRCGSTDGCRYSFVVQVRMHDTTVTGLWLDEVAAHLHVTVGNPASL